MDSGFHLVPLYFKTQKLPEAYSPFEINNSKNKQRNKQKIQNKRHKSIVFLTAKNLSLQCVQEQIIFFTVS